MAEPFSLAYFEMYIFLIFILITTFQYFLDLYLNLTETSEDMVSSSSSFSFYFFFPVSLFNKITALNRFKSYCTTFDNHSGLM